MSDFEVLQIGTAEEIRLSRKLTTAISNLQLQWGNGIVPNEIDRAQKALTEFYTRQMERELQ